MKIRVRVMLTYALGVTVGVFGSLSTGALVVAGILGAIGVALLAVFTTGGES